MLSEREREHIFPRLSVQKLRSFLPVSVDFRWMDELIHEKTEEDFLPSPFWRKQAGGRRRS